MIASQALPGSGANGPAAVRAAAPPGRILGYTAAVPDLWPPETPQELFLQRAVWAAGRISDRPTVITSQRTWTADK